LELGILPILKINYKRRKERNRLKEVGSCTDRVKDTVTIVDKMDIVNTRRI
jgi:archaellum biogenesis ATPase FlaH